MEALEEKILSRKEKKELKKKKKNFFAKRLFNMRKLNKPQKVAVLYYRKTGTIEPYEVEAKKGFFTVDDKTYHIERHCKYDLVLGRERIPVFSQMEEGLTPMKTHEFYDKFQTIEDFESKVAEAQNQAIRAMRYAELVRAEGRDGPKVNPKVAIGIVIVAIIAFAIFRSYAG